jgi:hypothetical protein
MCPPHHHHHHHTPTHPSPGLEYEAFLYQQLEAAGVPFWSEAELRDRGLFKTPDALLQVRGASGGGGYVRIGLYRLKDAERHGMTAASEC